MRADEAQAQREAIAQRLNAGHGINAIARELGCSRSTVRFVDRALQDPHATLADARLLRSPTRPTLPPTVEAVILALRQAQPTLGPRMLHAHLTRRVSDYELDPAVVPSPATIGRLLQREGLAVKPVGPRDARHYPDEYPREPGTLTIDG